MGKDCVQRVVSNSAHPEGTTSLLHPSIRVYVYVVYDGFFSICVITVVGLP